jgi:hypothetical protein
MWGHIYVSEKLRELEDEAARRTPERPLPNRKPVLGPVARRAGRALRRIGEGLEAWGSAPPARETDAAC